MWGMKEMRKARWLQDLESDKSKMVMTQEVGLAVGAGLDQTFGLSHVKWRCVLKTRVEVMSRLLDKLV